MMTWPDYLSGRGVVVVERRDASGALDLRGEQPPKMLMTHDELFGMFFRENSDDIACGPENFFEWLRGHGWSVRAKTW